VEARDILEFLHVRGRPDRPQERTRGAHFLLLIVVISIDDSTRSLCYYLLGLAASVDFFVDCVLFSLFGFDSFFFRTFANKCERRPRILSIFNPHNAQQGKSLPKSLPSYAQGRKNVPLMRITEISFKKSKFQKRPRRGVWMTLSFHLNDRPFSPPYVSRLSIKQQCRPSFGCLHGKTRDRRSEQEARRQNGSSSLAPLSFPIFSWPCGVQPNDVLPVFSPSSPKKPNDKQSI